MLLADLDHGEKFKFKNDIWTKGERVARYSIRPGYDREIFKCVNLNGRGRPFNDNTEVEPCQMRLSTGGDIFGRSGPDS